MTVTSEQARSEFLEIVLPEHANHYGTLYGANALQIMGKAAFVCATQHSRCAVVMAAADTIAFMEPIKVGAIVKVSANVIRQGKSSMTVMVEIVADHPIGQVRAPSIRGRFTMVAVDAGGAPISLPSANNQLPIKDAVS